MKIVVWGTGGYASSILNRNRLWMKNIDIVCFVNNSHEKGINETFCEKNILSPDELREIDFDYIVILSTFYDEIRYQIVNELMFPPNVISSLEQIAYRLVESNKTEIFKKKVALWGDGLEDFPYVYHLRHRVKALTILSDEKKSIEGISCIKPDLINQVECDYILLSDEDTEKRNRKIDFLSNYVLRDKILILEEWLPNLAFEYEKRCNTSNNIYFAVVPRPKLGLSAIFLDNLRMCEYAYEKNWIPFIDMKNVPSMYLAEDKLGKENAWEYYFTQTFCSKEKSLDYIYTKENIVIPSMFWSVDKYRNIKNKETFNQLRKIYRRSFSIKESIARRFEQESKKLFSQCCIDNVLACIYRGTDYTSIQPANHPIQPQLEEVIQLCKKQMELWECEYLFVATEDEEALEKFKKTFANCLLYTNQMRYSNTGNLFLAQIHNQRDNDEYMRGEEYLLVMLLLAQCKYLISGVNGAYKGAMVLKEDEYLETYIFDKGKYPSTNKFF